MESSKKQINEELPKLLSAFEETQKQFSSLEFDSHMITTKTSLDLLDKYKQDLHDMIEMHFDHLKLSFLGLSSTLPCKETVHIMSEYIEENKKELKLYQEKFYSEVTESDVRSYQTRQFALKNMKMMEMFGVLANQKANVTFEEPEILINPNVYSRLYHTLCEFITTSLYHNMPQQQDAEKKGNLLIERPDYFVNPDRVLPMINEEQKSLSLYSLLYDRTTSINLSCNSEIPYSPSIIITPDSIIYLCGGVLPNGNLTNKSYQFQTNKDTLGEVSNMIVKKAGHSLCFVNLGAQGGHIYSIGGRTNDGVRTKICEKYNILENKWEKIALMNSARSRAAVTPFDDKFIYAFYGTGSDMLNVQTCEKYDISMNFWKKIEIYNDFTGFEVSFAGAVQINDKQILVFGGFNENEQEKGSIIFSKKIMTFNVNNLTFRLHIDQMPTDFSLSCSSTPVVDNNQIFCLGFFLQSLKPQSSRFLDCDYVLRITGENCEVRNLIYGEKKQLGKNAQELTQKI